MTPTEHLEAIAEHRKAVFAYFGFDRPPFFDSIDDMTNVHWRLYGTTEVGWWDAGDDGDDPQYVEEVVQQQVHRKGDYTLVHVRLSTGSNAVMLFNNSKEAGGS